jgi:nucleoid-associated protein YgaU
LKFLSEKRENYFVHLVLAGIAISAAGCSFFSTKHDQADSDSRAFHQTASVDGMPIPLPVEIADDISRIANGGRVEQSRAWQVVSPSTDTPSEADQSPPEPVAAMSDTPQTLPSKRSISSTSSSISPRRNRPSGPAHNESYVVKNGDTLMKISFEKFGNVYRWREIYDANKGHIADFNRLVAGTVLTVNGVEYVVIDRNGTPYLIRRNDTLTKISSTVYGAPSHWKSIWHNNPQLIHDPNKIYTGFTLYYADKANPVEPTLTKTTSHDDGEKDTEQRIPASPTLPAPINEISPDVSQPVSLPAIEK